MRQSSKLISMVKQEFWKTKKEFGGQMKKSPLRG
jgi:hypothetical protein